MSPALSGLGDVVEVFRLPPCDVCLDGGRVGVPAGYDVRSASGVWVRLCAGCYGGQRLGSGHGQRLVLVDRPTW